MLRVRVEKVDGAYRWTDYNQNVEVSGIWTEEDTPQWVQDSMYLMNIVDESTELENIGYRHSDTVVYLTIKGDLYGKRS